MNHGLTKEQLDNYTKNRERIKKYLDKDKIESIVFNVKMENVFEDHRDVIYNQRKVISYVDGETDGFTRDWDLQGGHPEEKPDGYEKLLEKVNMFTKSLFLIEKHFEELIDKKERVIGSKGLEDSIVLKAILFRSGLVLNHRNEDKRGFKDLFKVDFRLFFATNLLSK